MPRTPQQNPWAEHTIGAPRGETEIASDSKVDGVQDVERRLTPRRNASPRSRALATCTRATLDARGDKIGAQRYTPEHRERLYHAAGAAVEQATRDCESERERRKAEREAILVTLERFGVSTRTWGSAASDRVKRERIA